MAISDWTGELDIDVFYKGGKSVARDIYFQGALKVMRPIYLNDSPIPTFYLSNVGGGYLDGDTYRMGVTVNPNAKVTLTTQGATKIYKSPTNPVEQYQTFDIDDNAYMEYVGDPIIAYRNARFFQHNRFNMTDTSAMFYTDILTPGYAKDDTDFSYDYMHLINEIYVNDRLAVYDNLIMNPQEKRMADMGYMEGYTHLGSCYYIHPDVTQSLIDDIYELIKPFTRDCRIGLTLLPLKGLSIRVLANKTQRIEQVFLEVQKYIMDKHYEREIDFLRKY
ncbi:urease accessory protein UreD [Staphylococcus massiliensis]|uniref:urease accessory protein UreD n=1 Tax=Staphylococcus massiliensis TaxID=555791 RepID=UPI001EDFADF8|nr:urease accessory protein UreD [Staphylococcus massiliensis]MCG3411710.1 urease accessory protein UreD [Staphylococcus massiliensis]